MNTYKEFLYACFSQGSWSASSGGSSFEGNRLSIERNRDFMASNNRYSGNKIASSQPPIPVMNNTNLQVRTQGSPPNSFSGSSDCSGPRSFQSSDMSFENLDYSRASDVSRSSFSSQAGVSSILEKVKYKGEKQYKEQC